MKISFDEEQKEAWKKLPTDITNDYIESYTKNKLHPADVLDAFIRIVQYEEGLDHEEEGGSEDGDDTLISTIMKMLDRGNLKQGIIKFCEGYLGDQRGYDPVYRQKVKLFYTEKLNQPDPDVLHDDPEEEEEDEFFDALQDAPEDVFFDSLPADPDPLLADSEEEVKKGDIVFRMSGERTLGDRIVGYAPTEDVITARFYMDGGDLITYDPKVSMVSILEHSVVRALDIIRKNKSSYFDVAEINSYILRMQTINPSKGRIVALSLNQLLLNPTDIGKLDELVMNLRNPFTPGTGIIASWARLMGRSEKNGDQLADEIQHSINYLSSEGTQHSCS